MDTDTMNIALPSNLKEYAQAQTSQEGYSSVSEYIRELILSDQKRKAKEALETEILKGIGSGGTTLMTAKDWEDIRAEVVKRHSARKKAGTR